MLFILLIFIIGAFDASVVDLYKGAHAVIFLISPFDIESLNYAQSLYKEIPLHINILLILSFRDKVQRFHDDPSIDNGNSLKKKKSKKKNSIILANEKKGNYDDSDEDNDMLEESSQAVSFELQILDLLSEIRDWRSDHESDHKEGYKDLGESVHAIEISNLNCYGLKELHQYIMLPYLRYKRKTFLEQAEQMRKKINNLGDEIYKESVSDTNNYAPFMKKYTSRLKASSLDKSAGSKNESNHTELNDRKNGDDDNDDDNDDDDDEEEMIREKERAKAKVKEDSRKARKSSKAVIEESLPDDRSNDSKSSSLKIENKPVKKAIVEEEDAVDNSNSDDIYAYRPNVGKKALSEFLDSSDEEEKPVKVLSKVKAKQSKFDEPALPAAPVSSGLKRSGLQRVGRKSKVTNSLPEKPNTEPETVVIPPVAIVREEVKVQQSKVSSDNNDSDSKRKIDTSKGNKRDESLAEFLDSDNDSDTNKNKVNVKKSKTNILKNSVEDDDDVESASVTMNSVKDLNHDPIIASIKEEDAIKVPGVLRRPRKNKVVGVIKTDDDSFQVSSYNTPNVSITEKGHSDGIAVSIAPEKYEEDSEVKSVLRRPRKSKSNETFATNVENATVAEAPTTVDISIAKVPAVDHIATEVPDVKNDEKAEVSSVHNVASVPSVDSIAEVTVVKSIAEVPAVLSLESALEVPAVESVVEMPDAESVIERPAVETFPEVPAVKTVAEISAVKNVELLDVESINEVLDVENVTKISAAETIEMPLVESVIEVSAAESATERSDTENRNIARKISSILNSNSDDQENNAHEDLIVNQFLVADAPGYSADDIEEGTETRESATTNEEEAVRNSINNVSVELPLIQINESKQLNIIDIVPIENSTDCTLIEFSSNDDNEISTSNTNTSILDIAEGRNAGININDESNIEGINQNYNSVDAIDTSEGVTMVHNNLDTIEEYRVEVGNVQIAASVASISDEDNNESNINKSNNSISNIFITEVNDITVVDNVAGYGNELEAFIADGDDDSLDDGKLHTNDKLVENSTLGNTGGGLEFSLSRKHKKLNRLSRNVFNDDDNGDDDDDDNVHNASNKIIVVDDDEVKIRFDKITTVKDSKSAESLNSAISQIMSSFHQQLETGDNGYSNMNNDDDGDGDGKRKKKDKKKKSKKEKKAKKEKKKRYEDDADDDDDDDNDL